jgi:phage gpG-like protein
MLSLSLAAADALATRFDAFPDALRQALAVKADALAQALADSVRNDKLSGQVLSARSGRLRDSIAADVASDGDGIVADVGSFGVKYAAIQEYGGRTVAHQILPDKAKALAFAAGGAVRFARRVQHPGSTIPAHAYLQSTLDEQSDAIVAALAATPSETWEGA